MRSTAPRRRAIMFVAIAVGLVAMVAVRSLLNRHDVPAGTPVVFLIDLNTADAATLQLLPGVGPALADRIVAARVRSGPFSDIDQFRDRVNGIGPKLAKRIEPFISFREE